MAPTDDPYSVGPDTEYMPSPWPEFDEHLHLRPGHLIGIGALPDGREANFGHDLAVHTAAQGVRTILWAPLLPPRNPLPNLHVQRRDPCPARIESVLESFAPTRQPVELVVIDHFGLITADLDGEPVYQPEQAADLGRRLKMLAATAAIVVMAPLTPRVDDCDPLHLRNLGLAAELEYDADTLLLLNATAPHSVDVLIAKDRHSYAPRKVNCTW
ncbi:MULTISPECIES: DnaB helicase C-terminal domain-containing protein [Streptomyces]|uniref:DnaB helicase C-terminal domain-containing protein n=1 Tax=Streptomyces TaxID=1883 RepID=UPI001FD26F17|nr:DnaB helicase C-terminal domain-containing protein [Streptomyces kasugaensis]